MSFTSETLHWSVPTTPPSSTRAVSLGRIVVTADTDFTTMLALRRADRPSVVLLRGVNELRPPDHARLLIDNLPQVESDLDAGAVVSLSPTRLAVRRLPLGSD